MPLPGDMLAGRYRIESLLGAGGMATVHRAHDDRLRRDVAVKVLLPNLASDPVTARRFEQEARAMAAVADPGLVAVFDVDSGDAATGREPFVVMELCSGGSLADRIGTDRPMAPDDLIPILVSVANALAALHRAGLVHRDIKPSNILFTADRAKLGDFGLARSGLGDATDLTEPGTAVGTLGYLAPERLRGEPGGPAADVFALGTVAYLGLTGQMPRPTGSVRDVVAAAGYRPPAVSSAAPALGRAFDDVLFAALAVDPGRRPDALELGSGLVTALGRWTRSGRPGAPGDARRPFPVAPVPGENEDTPAAADDIGVAAIRQGGGLPDAAVGSGPGDGDPTTVTMLPLDRTAAVATHEATASRRIDALRGSPSSRSRTERRRDSGRPAGWPIVLAALAALAAFVVLFLAGQSLFVSRPVGSSVPAPASPTAPPSFLAAPSVSPSPSSSPSPTIRPSPTPNPTLAALDAVDAAIAAARGGQDGLKGKVANELESQAARVRRDIATGDQSAALRDARALDRRARDAADHLRNDAAARLTRATARLVDALGG